jgi:hypothetical protein
MNEWLSLPLTDIISRINRVSNIILPVLFFSNSGFLLFIQLNNISAYCDFSFYSVPRSFNGTMHFLPCCPPFLQAVQTQVRKMLFWAIPNRYTHEHLLPDQSVFYRERIQKLCFRASTNLFEVFRLINHEPQHSTNLHSKFIPFCKSPQKCFGLHSLLWWNKGIIQTFLRKQKKHVEKLWWCIKIITIYKAANDLDQTFKP